MSHPHGKYLGGIRTLDDLRARCYIEAESGCWRWRLSTMDTEGGAASVNIVLDGRAMRCRGRRAALLLAGKLRKSTAIVWQADCCGHAECVNPDHARQGSAKEFVRWQLRTGRQSTARKRISALKAARALSKLTPELAREIRASDEPGVTLAARYGVSESTVSSVRLGRRWREPGWML